MSNYEQFFRSLEHGRLVVLLTQTKDHLDPERVVNRCIHGPDYDPEEVSFKNVRYMCDNNGDIWRRDGK